MSKRRIIAGLLAGALIVAAAYTPALAKASGGDVNGDSQTNVLDVQMVAALLLNGQGARIAADVNHDGRIDILDFQLLLAQTTPSTAKTKSPRSQHVDSPGEMLSSPDYLRLCSVHRACQAWPVEMIAPPERLVSDIPGPAPPPKITRYIQGLAPHSPPIAA